MSVPGAAVQEDFWSVRHWKLPVTTLIVVTLALNVLGLSIPIAATQIFDRIVPSPNSPTLMILVLGVVGFAFLEAMLRLGRAYMLAQAGATFAWVMTYRVLNHIARSDIDRDPVKSSGSLEYLTAVQQTKEKYNGQVLVGITELFFLPVILCLIFYISVSAGFIISFCLAIFAVVTFADTVRLREAVNAGTLNSEERYAFLFSMLSSMHAIKAMAIEDNILRRYEALQGRIAHGNLKTAKLIGRLINAGPIANQIIMACMLTFGAFSVNQGQMTLGAVSGLVLLGGRVMNPLQRAVFIFVQLKDVDRAQALIDKAFRRPISVTPDDGLEVENLGHLSLDGLVYEHPDSGIRLINGISLTILPGEVVTISGPSQEDNSTLLHLMAGIIAPTEGTVELNGFAPAVYPQELLNKCVGYAAAHGQMFRGTIRDNITRFGEVTVDAAMDVATLMEIDALINELPQGLDTELLGGAAETIPPGLRQQLSILRAVATRPKLILLDNADRGLDRASYSRLHRFVAKIQGQATIVIVSDDANMNAQASRQFKLSDGKLQQVNISAQTSRTAYRNLIL
jgi:ATP-binding cassette subfamily C protein LapB